jgi:hypothetical protein
VWVSQVVKVVTTKDGEETVLEPDFVNVCSKLMQQIQGEGSSGRVSS